MLIAPLLGEKTYYSYVERGSKIFGEQHHRFAMHM